MLASYCCCNIYHKTSGLKQQKFITLWLWRSKVQHGSFEYKCQGVVRAAFFLEALGMNLFSRLFQFLNSCPHSLAHSPINMTSASLFRSLFLTLLPPLSLTKALIGKMRRQDCEGLSSLSFSCLPLSSFQALPSLVCLSLCISHYYSYSIVLIHQVSTTANSTWEELA